MTRTAVFTVQCVAGLIGVSTSRVYQLIEDGQIAATQDGLNHYWITKRALEAFQNNRRGPGRPRLVPRDGRNSE